MELHHVEALVPVAVQRIEIGLLLALAAALLVATLISLTQLLFAANASAARLRTPWDIPELRLVALALPLELLVEAAQFPLYQVWEHGTWPQVAFGLAHCTLEDLAILLLAYGIATVGSRNRRWYRRKPVTGGAWFLAAALAYAMVADVDPLRLLGTWGAAKAMPIVPHLGIPAVPLLQWVALPPLLLSLMQTLGGTYSRHRSLAASP